MNASLTDLLRRAADLADAGRGTIGCLVIKARGSTPQSAGALMIVDDAAGTRGTIGGGCVEAEVRQRAMGLLTARCSGVMRFKLDGDYGWDDGLICGGTLEVAIGPLPEPGVLRDIAADVDARRTTALSMTVDTDDGRATYRLELPPRDRLYIAGVGHVGQAVARLAMNLDFDVTIFDDRVDLLERYAPDGAAKRPGDIAGELANAPVEDDTYCLVVTRGHNHDERALAAVVERGARYVGMIGSRRKVKLIFDDLAATGVSRETLAAVAAPVGEDIGAVSVEEIAVSIAAQLVRVRRATSRPAVTGPHAVAPLAVR